MSSCPFCQTEISDELSLYGGHCPSCLIEIPGEESVTDPGLVGKSEPASAAAPEPSSRVGVVAALLLAGVAGAWWATADSSPESVAPVVARTANPIPISAHEDQPIPVVDDAPAEMPATSPPVRPVRRVATRHVKSRAQPPELGAAVAKDASVLPSGGGSGLGSAPSDVFSTIGAAPRSRAQESIVLKDSLQIEEMVGRVLNRGAKQLEQCYNQALKMNEGLRGAWYVDFTITPDGKPVAVSVEAMGDPHASMEACIQRNVNRWRFQRVAEHVDVARTYRFGS